VDAIERAQRLDPLSLIINTDLAQILYFAGRHEDAVAQCRKTLQMNAVLRRGPPRVFPRPASACIAIRKRGRPGDLPPLPDGGVAAAWAMGTRRWGTRGGGGRPP
jgi:hypothetical protein